LPVSDGNAGAIVHSDNPNSGIRYQEPPRAGSVSDQIVINLLTESHSRITIRPSPLGNGENNGQLTADVHLSVMGETLGATRGPAIAVEDINSKLVSVDQDVASTLVNIQAAVNIGSGTLTPNFAANDVSIKPLLLTGSEVNVRSLNESATASHADSSGNGDTDSHVSVSLGTLQAESNGDGFKWASKIDTELSDQIQNIRPGENGLRRMGNEAADLTPGKKSDESAHTMLLDTPSDVSMNNFALLESHNQTNASLENPSTSDRQFFSTRAPVNRISRNTVMITPDMLPLVDITQDDIDTIVKQVEGGITNIEDIYALSPLQDGILFHHIATTNGDPYLVTTNMSFDNKDILDRYLDAFQKVVNRHDILRTAFIWEHLSRPVQVVLRQAPVSIAELKLNPEDGPALEQLMARFDPCKCRINLTKAPLIQFTIAQDGDGRWILVRLMHHLIDDQYSLTQIQFEVQALLEGQEERLQSPQPFRDFIAQTRSGPSVEDHELFFTKMLADIDTPTISYGLPHVHDDELGLTESYLMLPQDLNNRLRGHAKRMGVSLARMCHLAWALVIARTSGQEKVIFGTVISGRQRAGSVGYIIGPFINTLPIRVDINHASIVESLYGIQADITALLEHEHASLALAQRCSGVPVGMPLFNSLFNYRRNTTNHNNISSDNGMKFPETQERTNYPLAMVVEDGGDNLGLIAQVINPLDPARVCGYMSQALQSLADALDHSPKMQVRDLEILPPAEHEMLIRSWNTTGAAYPDNLCIHQLFENQVEQTPDAIAVVYEDEELTYHELNARANSLAHYLIDLGVKPDSLVAFSVDRSLAMIIGLMAVLKAGGAYVPLDPTFASERLYDILTDASPSILVADNSGVKALGSSISPSMAVVDPNAQLEKRTSNPHISALGSHHLAYVIYTSGSTGKPKGVMIEHQGVVNQILTRPAVAAVGPSSRVLEFSSLTFDASVDEIFSALCFGGCLHVLPSHARLDPVLWWKYLEDHSITQAESTPTYLQDCSDFPPLSSPLTLILGGEALPPKLLKIMRALIPLGSIINAYGPTETTVDAITWSCRDSLNGDIVPIGRPIANKRIYVLDSYRKPVPVGVTGELYIAGAGVARGYLNRPDLTDKAFLLDPFVTDDESRMYRTGDLVRYLPDGNVMYLGRNDQQVKIRGFRIELGEIEARLVDHPVVREAVVLAQGEGSSKCLVAYIVTEPMEGLAHTLRTYISSKLPDYMVPAAFVQLDVLPLTPNGKLDRRALPKPDINAFVSQEYEAPQGEIESTLATIWAELLK
ncbi:hypothetical protein BGX26_002258, partial [Mortierella sp. AD094]